MKLKKITAGLLFITMIVPTMSAPVSAATSITEWTSTTNLSKNTTINGSLKVDASVNLNGYTLTVKGDLIQDKDIDISGGVLTVSGDLWLENGNLDINDGKVTVGGGFYGKTQDGNNGGRLQMNDENDYLLVNGDFFYQCGVWSSDWLTEGTLEVKGDFTQKSGTYDNFNAYGNHKVVLSGTGVQNVSFENPNNSGFNILETTNSKVKLNGVRINKLDSDVTVGSFEQYSDFDAAGHTLTVTNDLVEKGNITLNEGTVNVKGNAWVESGNLDLENGSLNVDGNLKFQTQDGNNGGRLRMDNENDYVLVNGDFVYQCGVWSSDWLTDGTLEVKGDFTQKSGTYDNFNAYGNHKVVLSGTGVQNVSFENPDNSGFNILETTNSKVKLNAVRINKLDSDVTVGSFEQYSNFDVSGYTFTVTNDLVEKGNITLNEGTVNVKGNAWVESGELNLNNGRMNVDGNLKFQKQDGTNGGRLRMDDENDYLFVNGDFVYQCGVWSSDWLTNGTLEVKGNFVQKSGTYDNFNAYSNHKVILSGTGDQNVSFENPNNSGVNILETTNANVNLNDVRVTTLDKDVVVGDFTQYGSLDLNGHTLTVTGDLVQRGNIDVNGGNLVVKGDYLLESGTLDLNDGKVTVDGDFRAQTKDTSDGQVTYTNGGRLRMDNENDYLLVNGDFFYQCGVWSSDWLTNGTLEVKGDFTQKSGTYDNFNAYGNHKVILSGTGVQNVNFENPNSSGINILETTNANVKLNGVRVSKLDSDVTVGYFDEYGSLDLDGHKLTIAGDLISKGDIDVNTGTITVTGNAWIESGSIDINTGIVTVNGNLKFQKQDGTNGGRLRMDNEGDYVLVYGDFVYQSGTWGSDWLTNGTLEVKGDFTQESGTYDNFNAQGNHKVLLSGYDVQTVKFQNPGNGSSIFEILEITKDKNLGYVFEPYGNWRRLIEHSELENNTTIDKTAFVVGKQATLETTVIGGAGQYKIGYAYKKSTDKTYTAIGTAVEADKATAVFKPTTYGVYEVKAIVVDGAGQTEEKTFIVDVKDVLSNSSAVDKTIAYKGDTLTITAKGNGGFTPYTYAYYYRKASTTTWTKIGSGYSTATTATCKPAATGNYEIRVDIKDDEGTVVSKILTVKMKLPIVNNSTVSAEKITYGEKVTLTASATGGSTPYTYEYLAKKSTATKYSTLKAYSTTATHNYKPSGVGTYDIQINVKDSDGTVESKNFTLVVKEPLVNNSTVSAEKITYGDKLTLTASATGGTGTYTYEYLAKKSTATKYSTLKAYSTTTSYNYKPSAAGTFNIQINVKDSDGTITTKDFTVIVKEPLVNNSTMSADTTVHGDGVTLTGKAAGGTGTYTYQYLAKKTTATKWVTLKAYSANASYEFKPTAAVPYDVQINVKDSDGTVVSKEFVLNVNEKLANTSTMSKDNLVFGNSTTLKGSATGGLESYTYEYLAKKTTATKWVTLKAYSTAAEYDFKPAGAVPYDVRINVKDSRGVVVSKDFTLEVRPVLKNESTVADTLIEYGDKTTLTGKATGGTAPYQYEYLAKKTTATKWVTLKAYSTTAAYDFKPSAATTYDIQINVKDSDGTVVSKNFTLKAKAPLVNTSTIDIDDKTVTFNASATGGEGGYTYTYYYKLETATTWTKTTATFTAPTSAAYDLKVVAADSEGTEKAKTFTVDFYEDLANQSTVSVSDKVTLKAKATGGTAPYTYAYYYKAAGETKWTKIGTEFGTAATASFTPQTGTSYTFKIVVKDADETTAAKTFKVKVS